MRLFKLSITMVAAALLLAATAGPAMGEVTDPLDSGSFDVIYDFDEDGVLPAGFTRAGAVIPTVADGTMVSDTSAGGDAYFMSGSGQIWDTSGVTWSTGYTVETKIRVDSIMDGAGYAYASYNLPVGGSGPAGWLNINPDGQIWGYSTKTNLGINDNSDDFHVFRFAQEPGANSFSVWRDDIRLASEIAAGWSYPGLVRMLFGDAGGSGGGAYEMDYLRFTPGAYRPVNEIMPTYTPPETIKPSADFTYTYEMDVDPTSQADIDLDGNGEADWTNYTGATPVSVDGNGMLLVPDGGSVDAGIEHADTIWPNVGFTAADGFTYEISMQVQQNQALEVDFATPIVFALSDNNEMSIIQIAEDGVNVGGGWLVSEATNDDAQHSFRVARDSDAAGGRWWIWRDGELLTPDGYLVNTFYTRDATYFGPGISGAASGSLEVDYIRLMAGAFAPEEVANLPGDANRDGAVDVSDLGILATNYGATSGKTWEEGDFNADTAVDVSDLGILATNYGTGTAATVPEPGSLLLLAGGLLGMMFYVKRQTRRSR